MSTVAAPGNDVVNRVANNVLREQRRAQRRSSTAWALVAMFIVIAFSIAMVGLLTAYFDAREDVQVLSDKVDANNERVNCRAAYANEVTEKQGAFLSAIGNLIVVIPASSGSDPVTIRNAIDRVKVTNLAYDEAIANRVAYESLGAPVPCPLDPPPPLQQDE